METSRATASKSRELVILLVAVLLAGLPLAVWLDLRNLTEAAPRRQAGDLNSVISSVRGYYASNIVARVLASPGSTYALVRDSVVAHALPSITMKGISREVLPYSVEGMLDATGSKIERFSEHMTGLNFYLDPSMVTASSAERVRSVLSSALAALERYGAGPIGRPPAGQST
jgi:hypothetical protein